MAAGSSFRWACDPEEWNIARIRPDGSGLFLITDDPDNEMFADWAP